VRRRQLLAERDAFEVERAGFVRLKAEWAAAWILIRRKKQIVLFENIAMRL
jgi:hypothetical protein